MAVKETIGDGGARKYANSQFSDQTRQNAISRVSAVQNSEPEVRALTVWRIKHTVTSTVQTAKECQRQLRLPTTPSRGTCVTAYTLHKSQKASSSLLHLTKKVT